MPRKKSNSDDGDLEYAPSRESIIEDEETESQPKTKARRSKKKTEDSDDSVEDSQNDTVKDKKSKKHKDTTNNKKKTKKNQDSIIDTISNSAVSQPVHWVQQLVKGDEKDKKKDKDPLTAAEKNKKKDKDPLTAAEKNKKKDKDPLTATEKEAANEAEEEILKSVPLPSSLKSRGNNKKTCIIGAINIQAFGTKKSANKPIMRIIVDILKRYDIILCQEIHAPNGKTEIIQNLVDSISTSSTPYAYTLSDPIGRNSYQERYLYLYRKNDWKVIDAYIIDDTKLGDKFIREPYVARFQHLKYSDVRINLVGCHTQPENAYNEIQALVTDVYPDVKKKVVQRTRGISKTTEKKEDLVDGLTRLFSYCCSCFTTSTEATSNQKARDVDVSEPIVIMGDFNASGSYLNKTNREELDKILQQKKLEWGIDHKSDTTVGTADAAYDRFIFEQKNMDRWIGKTDVWRFDEGWTNKSKEDPALVKKAAKRVTDHYPI
ncbi:7989_t:CDS:1, partial [Scutellospora calospora]